MKELLRIIALIYLFGLSLTGFAMMGIDKRRAKAHKWRISEKTLLLIAVLGGGIGSFLGMRFFRHKTKHTAFQILLPLMAVLYLFLGYALLTMTV